MRKRYGTSKNKNSMHQNNQNQHIPVLLEETLKYLDPKPGETYLDLTAGYGGHAHAVLERTLQAPATLVDRDSAAINSLKETFTGKAIDIIRGDFLSVSRHLHSLDKRYDMVLADIGLSSPHLNTGARGFSIQHDSPLDMRMDTRQELTAAIIVNTYDEADLTDLFRRYGEEPKAQAIARMIVQNRPVMTTSQLAGLVERVWPKGKSRTHPATRVFQALRIAVNDELTQLEQALPIWIELLENDGRLAVISFHSLEDRIVKRALAEASAGVYDARLRLLTKHPVTAGSEELAFNPRARSAKLRAAAKINT